jgi:hypothetical protein
MAALLRRPPDMRETTLRIGARKLLEGLLKQLSGGHKVLGLETFGEFPVDRL